MTLKPIFAQLEFTEGCIYNCNHCYNTYSLKRTNSFVKADVLNALIKSELFYITITGGEPLLYKKSLFNSIKKFKEANMDVSLNSNLYLLEKEDAKVLGDLNLNYLLSSILSFEEKSHDRITNKQGSFRRLIKSLDYLLGAGVNVSLNLVVSQENLHEIYETGKFVFDNFGITKFSATPIVPSSNETIKLMLGRKEYIHVLDELLRLEKDFGMKIDSLHPAIPCMFEDKERAKYKIFFEKRGCAAGKGAITFSPKGDLRVCSHEKRIYGNILKSTLEEILEKMDSWFGGSFIPDECKPCSYLAQCNGGCRVSAEVITNKIKGVDPYFIKSLKEEINAPELKRDIKNVQVVEGNIRYRKDNSEMNTIYVNPSINARVDNLEFEIFKRFMTGKNYLDISKEIGDVEITQKIIKNLIKKKLLKCLFV